MLLVVFWAFISSFFPPWTASLAFGQHAALVIVQIPDAHPAVTLSLQGLLFGVLTPSISGLSVQVAVAVGVSSHMQYFSPLCAAANAKFPFAVALLVLLETCERLAIEYIIRAPITIMNMTVARMKAPLWRKRGFMGIEMPV